jgi:hypothetical protein
MHSNFIKPRVFVAPCSVAIILFMTNSSEPAHYIVFHPERKRCTVSVRATALVGGRLNHSWHGKVRVDKPPGNEDPFVFGPSWAYSYCHATELRRQPRRAGGYVAKGSCILFCSGDLGDSGVLAVDTVFWIAEAHRWGSPSEPPDRYSQDVSCRTDIWRFHLRFGGQPEGHKGVYTYEAALHPQSDNRYSRLPVYANGERVGIKLSELSADLRKRITNKLKGKRPVPIVSEDIDAILQLLDARTEGSVVGDLTLNDPTIARLRKEESTGCQPCAPSRSEGTRSSKTGSRVGRARHACL